MTSEQRVAIMEKHVNALSEIYDAVQIVGTWLEKDSTTRSQKRGSGNWYARQQLCREFLEDNQQENVAKRIADNIRDGSEPAL
jgi:hypothetical protein